MDFPPPTVSAVILGLLIRQKALDTFPIKKKIIILWPVFGPLKNFICMCLPYNPMDGGVRWWLCCSVFVAGCVGERRGSASLGCAVLLGCGLLDGGGRAAVMPCSAASHGWGFGGGVRWWSPAMFTGSVLPGEAAVMGASSQSGHPYRKPILITSPPSVHGGFFWGRN